MFIEGILINRIRNRLRIPQQRNAGRETKRRRGVEKRIGKMGLTMLTAITIASNDPKDLKIEAIQDEESKKWTSVLYLLRNEKIHSTLLSFQGFPSKTKEEAIEQMEKTVQACIDAVKKKPEKE